MGRTANGRGLRDVMLALVMFFDRHRGFGGIVLWGRTRPPARGWRRYMSSMLAPIKA